MIHSFNNPIQSAGSIHDIETPSALFVLRTLFEGKPPSDWWLPSQGASEGDFCDAFDVSPRKKQILGKLFFY